MTDWFRVEESHHEGGVVVLHLHKYRVLRETPKGVWLDDWSARGRFVLRDAHKRWACPTAQEAWESFAARKRRQIRILSNQLRRAKTALELATREEAL